MEAGLGCSRNSRPIKYSILERKERGKEGGTDREKEVEGEHG